MRQMLNDNCSLMGFRFRCKIVAMRQAIDEMLRFLLNRYLLQSLGGDVAYMQWFTEAKSPAKWNSTIQFHLWNEKKKTKSTSHKNRKNCRKFFSLCGYFIMQTENAIIMFFFKKNNNNKQLNELMYTNRPKTWSLNNSNLDFTHFCGWFSLSISISYPIIHRWISLLFRFVCSYVFHLLFAIFVI